MTLMIISTIESIPIIRILIKTKTLIFDLKIIIYLKVALSLSHTHKQNNTDKLFFDRIKMRMNKTKKQTKKVH